MKWKKMNLPSRTGEISTRRISSLTRRKVDLEETARSNEFSRFAELHLEQLEKGRTITLATEDLNDSRYNLSYEAGLGENEDEKGRELSEVFSYHFKGLEEKGYSISDSRAPNSFFVTKGEDAYVFKITDPKNTNSVELRARRFN